MLLLVHVAASLFATTLRTGYIGGCSALLHNPVHYRRTSAIFASLDVGDYEEDLVDAELLPPLEMEAEVNTPSLLSAMSRLEVKGVLQHSPVTWHPLCLFTMLPLTSLVTAISKEYRSGNSIKMMEWIICPLNQENW